LMGAPAAATGFLRFIAEYTQSYSVTSVGKDAKMFPRFDAALAADMESEVTAFAAQVVGDGGGRFETLFAAPFSVVSPRLADLYGVPAPGSAWAKVMFPADQRAGLLTQAALLATQARPSYGDPVLRGKFIRERLLCSKAPPSDDNAGELARLERAFGKSGGNIRELVVDTVASTYFVNRRRTP